MYGCFSINLKTSYLSKGLTKQGRPRSDSFRRSSLIRVFPVCYSDSVLKTSILLIENRKRLTVDVLKMFILGSCQKRADPDQKKQSDQGLQVSDTDKCFVSSSHDNQHFVSEGESLLRINSLPTECHLLITFTNMLDPDQARQNIRPDLGPICPLSWCS